MTAPKNMSPDERAAWKERERLRRALPAYKEKARLRARRYYEKPGQKEAIIAKTKAARSTEEGRAHRNIVDRGRLQRNASLREKEKGRQKEWQNTEHGKQLNREKAKRHYNRKKIDREYEHFLSSQGGQVT